MMKRDSVRVDGDSGAWYVVHAEQQYTIYPDALVVVADALNKSASADSVRNALLNGCVFLSSRRGVSTTVRAAAGSVQSRHPVVMQQRAASAGNPTRHAHTVTSALSRIIWTAYLSPRWAELEKLARLMAESPASRKNRGTDSYRPVPIRHGGLI